MFFKKNDKKIDDTFLIKIGALLIYTAKIDENYFKYNPIKKFKKETTKKVSNENPFKILKNLNLG